ncbi:MAG: S-layer family protein [Cyanobacteria bacterium J06627_28]
MMLSRLQGMLLGGVAGCCWSMPAIAQTVTPTMGTGHVGTMVNGAGDYTVTGGTPQLNTLFHSFEDFSPQTANVLFQLDGSQSAIEYVIARVTGINGSAIDGELKLTGGNSPDLFLINPNGITFGENSSLSLPGSFVASTADSVLFQDDLAFSVSRLETAPLLNVSAPIGLQLGSVAGDIRVNNTGHSLARRNPLTGQASIFAPHVQLGATQGLQVVPGNTLALIGNGVLLNGGIVTANSGNLELGSVGAGSSVSLLSTPVGFLADYRQVETFSNAELLNQSLANVSGVPVQPFPGAPFRVFSSSQGSVQVVGQNINLQNESVVLGQSGAAATSPGGRIRVHANETLSLQGSHPVSGIRSGIFSETIGPAASGPIEVSANNINMQAGAGIIGFTFSPAAGSPISVQATDQLRVNGFNPVNPALSSAIGTASVSSGQSGDVIVESPTLLVSEGGSVVSLNLRDGSSGDLFINAENIIVTGRVPAINLPSALSVSNFGTGSQASNLTVTTQRLTIEDSGLIAASSSGIGAAGKIRIDASERIDIDGNNDFINDLTFSINAAVVEPSLSERLLFGLPANASIPSADSGDVIINTPTLNLNGPVTITVQNLGTGDAGILDINAETIALRNGSQIRSRTLFGNGGNIDLQAQNALILRNGSQISAESGGVGNGGNIAIASPFIIALENSDIIANAVQGRGGNIAITSQSVFGTAFRDQLTPESDITASSEFGINGTVEIDTPTVDPSSGVTALASDVVDSDQQVATGCSDGQSNRFVASGRGGLPQSPQVAVSANSLWRDVRPLSSTDQTVAAPRPDEDLLSLSPTEATAWSRSHNGEVQLLAGNDIPQSSTVCLRASQSSALLL